MHTDEDGHGLCEYRRELLRWPFRKLEPWQHRWLWRVPFLSYVETCSNVGIECEAPGSYEDENAPVLRLYYCSEHIHNAGFCRGCGQFWGGVETFEFLNAGGLCDNCRDDPDWTGDYDDEDDYDYPEDVR